MDNSFTDLSLAQAAGLTDAHRFWFGLPQASEPFWRPDFVPAGWLISSADDLGRFVAAQLNGGALDGRRVLSERGVTAMHAGAAATPLGRGAYGMGWIDGRIGQTRVVSHTGSTTDMASAMYLAPERGVGLVLLLNGQSVLYELLHKPDAIGEAAFARMLGEPAGGTLSALYPAFTLAMALLVALQGRALVRAVRAGRRGQPSVRTALGSRWLGIGLAVWGSLVVPVLILWTVPATLGAPWSILVQIDVGQALAAYAGLRISHRSRDRWPDDRPARQGDEDAAGLCAGCSLGVMGAGASIREWLRRHPDLAEPAIGLAAALAVLSLALVQWGVTDEGWVRGISLGVAMGLVVDRRLPPISTVGGAAPAGDRGTAPSALTRAP